MVGDLLTGAGLPTTVAAVGSGAAARPTHHPDDDLDAAVRLLLATRAAAVPHLVYISIVGVDRVPCPLYKANYGSRR